MAATQKFMMIVYLSELVNSQSFGWSNFNPSINNQGYNNIPSFISPFSNARTNLGFNNYETQPYYNTRRTSIDNQVNPQNYYNDNNHRSFNDNNRNYNDNNNDWNNRRDVTTKKVYDNGFGSNYGSFSNRNNDKTTARPVFNNDNRNNNQRTSTTERAYNHDYNFNGNNRRYTSTERVLYNNRNNNNDHTFNNGNEYNQRTTTKRPYNNFGIQNNNNDYTNNNNQRTSTERSSYNNSRNKDGANSNKETNNRRYSTTERSLYNNNQNNNNQKDTTTRRSFNNNNTGLRETTTKRSIYNNYNQNNYNQNNNNRNENKQNATRNNYRTTTKKPTTKSFFDDDRNRYDIFPNTDNLYDNNNNKRKNKNNRFFDTDYDNDDSNSFDDVSNETPKKDDIPFTSFVNTPDDSFFVTNKPFFSNFGTTRKPVRTNKKTTSAPMTNEPDIVRYPDDSSSPELIIGPDETGLTERQKNSYVNMVERLCETYKSLNTKQVQAIPLLPSPDPVKVNVTNCRVPTPLIVGGKVVTIGQFPHQAAVGWRYVSGPGYGWKCGGSLISDQYVLTAAHCAFQERDESVVPGPPSAVQLGSTYLDGSDSKVYLVKTAIRHPRYLLPRSYYDLAMLRLKERVGFTDTIKPACLGTPPGTGEKIIATGWGQTSQANKGQISKELRGVSLPVWDIRTCSKSLGSTRNLPNGPMSDCQMCAGEPRGGKDTCQGDSGGPAQIKDGCTWRIVAVTSIGRSCAAVNTPAVYAIVQKVFIGQVIAEGL